MEMKARRPQECGLNLLWRLEEASLGLAQGSLTDAQKRRLLDEVLGGW